MQQAEGILPSTHPDADGDDQAAAAELKRTAHVLGLLGMAESEWTGFTTGGCDLQPLVNRLTALRTSATATKDFSAVDSLKSALTAAGVEVRMSKAGVELVPGPDFDPAKLEALK
jgi:cysteinyl-tRNA synthetase